MEIFIGIDGGGTKTKFTLKKGDEVYSSKEKTIHPMQATKEEFYERIKNGIESVCKKAQVSISDISYTFAAIPGFGQYAQKEKDMPEIFEKILGTKNFKLANDAVVGWAGSLEAKEGVNLVLGTGAITYGVDKNGKKLRASGWGPKIGDEGSGYWIGMQIINAFTKQADFRHERGALYNIVKDYFSIENDLDIINIVEGMKREEIAAISQILMQSVEKDDKDAKAILDKAAFEAASAIDATIEKLDFDNPVKVSYSGGVFNIGEVFINKIKKYSTGI